MQKHVTLPFQAPFYTHGTLTPQTRHIWIVCHGFGQLAHHFMKRFDVLDESHYVIAPQGLARFYYASYTKVGASWTTRENKDFHITNQLTYLDAVLAAEVGEVDWDTTQLHLLGFSQGVSVITRWAASRKIAFDRLILWAGGFPPELAERKWKDIKPDAQVTVVIGNRDRYLFDERLEEQKKLLFSAFDKPEIITFEGGHEIVRDVLKDLINDF